MQSKLLNVEIEVFYLFFFLKLFVTSELLAAKNENCKSNQILNYIYNEKPLHILEIYGSKNVQEVNIMYNLNLFL